ncbi:MAG TPA: sugar ABC transporter ATP-binding protein [Acetobacteraceae bacterium]|nr:sugar ABC transporter ATP-binding protein [Acetobacteraceae bacterium]
MGTAADAGGIASPVLAITGLTKRFGSTVALQDVDLSIRPGEILALLGENGAGKSTLIKCLAGVHAADAGEIRWHGALAGTRRLPIAFIHQDLGLIEWMTVAENVSLTLGYPRRRGLVDWPEAVRRARDVLHIVGLDIDPDTRVASLGRIERSMVAIARALAAEAEVVVLDEPTASLPTGEATRLFTALRALRARGTALIYVSHRLDEVFEIADRMVVLRDGRVAGVRPVAGTSMQDAILLIVGREPGRVFRRPALREGAERLRLDGLASADVGPVDLSLRAGEVVGLVGLRGAGQEVIGRALFGLQQLETGRIVLDGKTISPASPRAAMAAGIDLVCGERGSESVLPSRTVRENFFPNPLAAGRSAWSLLRPQRERAAARALGAEVALRPNAPELSIEALSGGNQQKVVIGRWLNLRASVYVIEDPTAGVDVGAKAEIYRLLDVALAAGAAILLVSGDFEEVAKICHRALVFDRGRVVVELAGDDLSVEALLAAASASAAAAA